MRTDLPSRPETGLPEIRGLTIRQPWALAIAHFGKDVENRTWRTSYRGLVAIHAGAALDRDFTGFPARGAERRRRVMRGKALLSGSWPEGMLVQGQVVAVADLAGCHSDRDCELQRGPGLCSPWAARWGWHWELASLARLPCGVPCKGKLGLWQLPGDVDSAVRAHLAAAA